MKKHFPAVRFEQISGAGKLATIYMLAAPASEIVAFAGIPRKEVTEAGGGETIGYQRPRADRKLPLFLSERANIIPTSLLLASRDHRLFEFTPNQEAGGDNAAAGLLTITMPVDEHRPLSALLRALVDVLKKRPFDKTALAADPALIARAKRVLPEPKLDESDDAEELDEDGSQLDESSEAEGDSAEAMAATLYSQDSHIEQFYVTALSALAAIEEEPALDNEANILGFSRDMLLDYLKPAIVVDGQHRLLGAVEARDNAWREAEESDEAIAERVDSGQSVEDIRSEVLRANDRWLPVCLMANDDWSEHVFQFVVVNQKAASINKALLSSIISTSLTDEELGQVKPRLGSASIKIEDITIVGRLRTVPGPFQGLIRAGFDTKSGTEDRQKLEHTSVIKLFKIFRELRGARDPNELEGADAARVWRKPFLQAYEPVQDFADHEFSTRLQYWSSANGPWRDPFQFFHQCVKDNLSDNNTRRAYWGDVTESNLFTFATLQVLEIQFFQYMNDRESYPTTLHGLQAEIEEYVARRLNREFFLRKWNMDGRRLDKANQKMLHRYVKLLWKTHKGQIKNKAFDEFFLD